MRRLLLYVMKKKLRPQRIFSLAIDKKPLLQNIQEPGNRFITGFRVLEKTGRIAHMFHCFKSSVWSVGRPARKLLKECGRDARAP